VTGLTNASRWFEPERPPQFTVDLLEENLFRLKWAVKGAPFGAPPAAVETLDSPFQSEFSHPRDRRRMAAASEGGGAARGQMSCFGSGDRRVEITGSEIECDIS
jgi:hypothetical protein